LDWSSRPLDFSSSGENRYPMRCFKAWPTESCPAAKEYARAGTVIAKLGATHLISFPSMTSNGFEASIFFLMKKREGEKKKKKKKNKDSYSSHASLCSMDSFNTGFCLDTCSRENLDEEAIACDDWRSFSFSFPLFFSTSFCRVSRTFFRRLSCASSMAWLNALFSRFG